MRHVRNKGDDGGAGEQNCAAVQTEADCYQRHDGARRRERQKLLAAQTLRRECVMSSARE